MRPNPTKWPQCQPDPFPLFPGHDVTRQLLIGRHWSAQAPLREWPFATAEADPWAVEREQRLGLRPASSQPYCQVTLLLQGDCLLRRIEISTLSWLPQERCGINRTPWRCLCVSCVVALVGVWGRWGVRDREVSLDWERKPVTHQKRF